MSEDPTTRAAIPTIATARPHDPPGLLMRAVWFVFIGWWLSAVAIGVAYFLCAIIIGMPLGFMIFNALPWILTLRPRTDRIGTEVHDGVAYTTGGTADQLPLWIRAVWFIFVGWWLGAIYMTFAWSLCVLIVTLPDRAVAVQPDRRGHDPAALLMRGEDDRPDRALPPRAGRESLGQRAERQRPRAPPRRAVRRVTILLQNISLARARSTAARARGRGGHRHRPPGAGLPGHRGQGRPDPRATAWVAGGPATASSIGPPFEQAADSHHSLVAKLKELPDWQAGLDPIAGHAVAFPNVDLASLDAKILMGTDADPELILDKAILAPGPAAQPRSCATGSIAASSCGTAGRSGRPGRRASSSCQAMMTSPLELRIAASVRDRRRQPRGRAR